MVPFNLKYLANFCLSKHKFPINNSGAYLLLSSSPKIYIDNKKGSYKDEVGILKLNVSALPLCNIFPVKLVGAF